MNGYSSLFIPFLISLLSTFLLTYPVKRLAYTLGTLDFPEPRKIHQKVIPRLGGLAIFIGTFLGVIYLQPVPEIVIKIGVGAMIILLTGLLDDKYELRPVHKLTGQIAATTYLILSGLTIDRITLPLVGIIELDYLSIPITMFWIIGITNAINLIDGLDGLATGVTIIALLSIFVMALIDAQIIVVYLCIILIGANVGFLYHNFYPAQIYMGDSGSNFLGFMIATISILGLFKNITLFSFVFPVIILAVPIFDTFLVILRRFVKKDNIMLADKKHIHYQLLDRGYTHRQAVLILYGFSALFGLKAILLSKATFLTSLFITIIILLLLFVLVDVTGLTRASQPVLHSFRKIIQKKDLK